MSEILKKVKGEKYGLCNEKAMKNKRILPTISFTEEDLPEIKDWKVGDKYFLVMEVEQISLRQGSEWQGEEDDKAKETRATFKILSVGVNEGETESYEEEYARKRSGK